MHLTSVSISALFSRLISMLCPATLYFGINERSSLYLQDNYSFSIQIFCNNSMKMDTAMQIKHHPDIRPLQPYPYSLLYRRDAYTVEGMTHLDTRHLYAVPIIYHRISGSAVCFIVLSSSSKGGIFLQETFILSKEIITLIIYFFRCVLAFIAHLKRYREKFIYSLSSSGLIFLTFMGTPHYCWQSLHIFITYAGSIILSYILFSSRS